MYFSEICKQIISDFCVKNNVQLDNNKITYEFYKLSNEYELATNAAMILARQFKMDSYNLAVSISKEFLLNKNIKNAIVIKPGFININFHDETYQKFYELFVKNNFNIQEVFYPVASNLNYSVEFVSANPTGYLHIGHARHAIYGDILVNIFKYSKNNVTKIFYVNDFGKQMKMLTNSVFLRYLEKCLNKDFFSGKENLYFGEEIIHSANLIYEKCSNKYQNVIFLNNEINCDKCYQYFFNESYNFFISSIKKDLDLINVNFDVYKKESDFQNDVKKNIEYLKQNNFTYLQENALFLKTTLKGDDKDRVIIKSNNEYTYIVSDMALFKWKLSQKFCKNITVLGADHHGYIPRIKATLLLLGQDISSLEFPLIRLVKILKDNQECKMSKRSGNAIWLRDLYSFVGKDSLRILMISNLKNTTLEFDIDKAVSQDSNNPVYYCQYAYARCNQLLENSKNFNLKLDFYKGKFFKLNPEEKKILISISEFDKVLTISKLMYEPYYLFSYLFLLVKMFHVYYNNNKIIDINNVELTFSRLIIINLLKSIFSEIFTIIGIKSIKKM